MLTRGAFIPFVVAGDPSLADTERFVDALAEEDADVVELGVPFSDAIADGPVIQAASERAATHVTLTDVLALAARIKSRHPRLGLVLFTYLNPVFRLGFRRFAAAARAHGVDAALVVDLPPEEADEHREAMAEAGVKTVFLASPTTSPARLRRIAEASTGFVYYVSRAGVTGERAALSSTLAAEVARLREVTDKPIAVGFGISTPEQAAEVARFADGVVVGSAFVRAIAEGGDAVGRIREMVRSLAGFKRP